MAYTIRQAVALRISLMSRGAVLAVKAKNTRCFLVADGWQADAEAIPLRHNTPSVS